MELVDEEEQEVVLALSLLLESSILGLSESVGGNERPHMQSFGFCSFISLI